MTDEYRRARYGLTFRVSAESLDRERAECQRLAEAEDGDMPDDEGGPFSAAAQAADAAFREMCRRVDAQRAEMLGAGGRAPMSSGETYSESGPVELVWSPAVGALVAQLPHQCSEWVIGGAEEVQALIGHLQTLLPEFDHPDRYRHPHQCQRCGAVSFAAEPVCPGRYCQGRDEVCARCFYDHIPARAEGTSFI